MSLTFHLRDKNPEVVKGLQKFFASLAHVDIGEGDLLELKVSAVVVPINSFGIMSSGFARDLNLKSNGNLEPRIRQLIADTYAGELPVGNAEVLTSGMDSPEIIVVSPTVRVPPDRMTNPNVNTYLSTRAALRAVAAYMRKAKQEERDSNIQ